MFASLAQCQTRGGFGQRPRPAGGDGARKKPSRSGRAAHGSSGSSRLPGRCGDRKRAARTHP